MSSIETLVHSLVLDYKYDNIEYNTTQDDQRDHEDLDCTPHNKKINHQELQKERERNKGHLISNTGYNGIGRTVETKSLSLIIIGIKKQGFINIWRYFLNEKSVTVIQRNSISLITYINDTDI